MNTLDNAFLQVFKIFWSTTYMEIPAVLLEKEMFVGWMQCLHNFITRPVPAAVTPVRSLHRLSKSAHESCMVPWHQAQSSCSSAISPFSLILVPYIPPPPLACLHYYAPPPSNLSGLHDPSAAACCTLQASEDAKSSPWWKAKKWALHIAYRLFSRYGVTKHCKDGNDKAFSAIFVVRASC